MEQLPTNDPDRFLEEDRHPGKYKRKGQEGMTEGKPPLASTVF